MGQSHEIFSEIVDEPQKLCGDFEGAIFLLCEASYSYDEVQPLPHLLASLPVLGTRAILDPYGKGGIFVVCRGCQELRLPIPRLGSVLLGQQSFVGAGTWVAKLRKMMAAFTQWCCSGRHADVNLRRVQQLRMRAKPLILRLKRWKLSACSTCIARSSVKESKPKERLDESGLLDTVEDVFDYRKYLSHILGTLELCSAVCALWLNQRQTCGIKPRLHRSTTFCS